MHYTGIATSSALDQNGGTPTSDAGTAWTSAQVTTTQNDELLIGTDHGRNNGANATFAASGSWAEIAETLTGVAFDGNGGGGISTQEQIVAVTQTNIANTGTNVSALVNNWAGIATFKMATSGDTRRSTMGTVGVGR